MTLLTWDCSSFSVELVYYRCSDTCILQHGLYTCAWVMYTINTSMNPSANCIIHIVYKVTVTLGLNFWLLFADVCTMIITQPTIFFRKIYFSIGLTLFDMETIYIRIKYVCCYSTVFIQVCSAIHNQEYTLIEDYVSGLKCLLYLQVSYMHIRLLYMHVCVCICIHVEY